MKVQFVEDEETKKKEKPPAEKTACPFCGSLFKSVWKHLPYCNSNPGNERLSKDRSKNKRESKTERAVEPQLVMKERLTVPDFNDLLQFCEKHVSGKDDKGHPIFDDFEVAQFYQHVVPRMLYKKRFGTDRGGGGWSGPVKATINILRKMKKEGDI